MTKLVVAFRDFANPPKKARFLDPTKKQASQVPIASSSGRVK
jgi:hypothetical protein